MRMSISLTLAFSFVIERLVCGASDDLSYSKCWRSVDPQQPGLAAAWIFPVMRRGAFKIKTVAALQMVLLAVKSDLQFAAQHKQKFLTFVGVGFATAGSCFDTKEVRLHYFVAPS